MRTVGYPDQPGLPVPKPLPMRLLGGDAGLT